MVRSDLAHATLDAALHASIAACAVGAVLWRLRLKMVVVGY